MQHRAERLFGLRWRHPLWCLVRSYIYTMYWIRHPARGSTFDRKTRRVRWLPGWILIPVMRTMGYDAIYLFVDKQIRCHVFFQRHGEELHMFSVAVHEKFRGYGLMSSGLAQYFIPHAHDTAGVYEFIMSFGGKRAPNQEKNNHEAVVHFCHKLAEGRIPLPNGIIVNPEDEFRFSFPLKRAKDAANDCLRDLRTR